MTVGEYASMKAMYNAPPEFVPWTLGCGSYASNPNIHLFICELVNITDEIPETQAFVTTRRATHQGYIPEWQVRHRDAHLQRQNPSVHEKA